MGNRLVHMRKGFSPLPIKDGLNPTRVRVPAGPITAWAFLEEVITAQRHRSPLDDAAALQARFDNNEVVLRDQTVLSPETLLSTDTDVFFYRMPAPETPVPYDIPIIYEDKHLLVVDKPPFMATMPRAKHIVQTATVQMRRKTGIDELTPAHRLDRLTSGILVFTKTKDVRGAYQTLFAERRVQKTYEAIAPLSDVAAGTVWESRIEKTPGEIQGRIVDGPVNAITILADVTAVDNTGYENIHGKQPPLARYTLKPKTGKTHQLRLHMWQAGVPILGDPVYPVIYPADAENMRVPMHLTATHIAFTDPLSGKPREFSSNLPLVAHNFLHP
ncbi:pseudouridine synthase [Corynebacterium sp. HMSC076D02]|uniref:pseudouridine synthase n=1 Tax=Corynebacterium sp. HMSC076D02 TaxID=1739439 RepID=UPI0008A34AEE|nr:pseudouridine synthase [Corynebacterium sp. HMSC076D02]OFQ47996.1 23S rRNA pseudouridylate synthase [Corynebacterium sp. HMSC076D02]